MPPRPVSLLHSLIALYGAQIANVLLPLVAVPYLARVLGPVEWGLVAMAQAVGVYVNLVAEYGFGLSAARDAARLRECPAELAALVAGVHGARLSLCGAGAVIVCLAPLAAPALAHRPLLLAAALVWGVAQAFHPGWLFQSFERVRLMCAIDAGAKAAATAAMFALVHSPADGWKALAAQAGGAVLSTGVGLAMASRLVRLRAPRWREATAALRAGWHLFAYRGALSLYSTANVLILGWFAPAAAVGQYAGAEKIVRAGVNLLWPAHTALYPRMARSAGNPGAAERVLIRLLVGGAAAAAAGTALAASLVVRVLLGPGYEGSVPILRLLAALMPLIAVSGVLGIQRMLPLGMDREFTWIALGAGVLNVAIALALAPRMQGLGMAAAVVTAEAAIVVAQHVALRRRLASSSPPAIGAAPA